MHSCAEQVSAAALAAACALLRSGLGFSQDLVMMSKQSAVCIQVDFDALILLADSGMYFQSIFCFAGHDIAYTICA